MIGGDFTINPPANLPVDTESLRRAMMAGGQRVVDDITDYYAMKDGDEPNRFVAHGEGGRRVHFWKQVGDSITGPTMQDDGSVVVEITDPRIRQKVLGGEIRAKNVRYLTIPVNPMAYARKAAELFSLVGKLFVLRLKDGRKFLAARNEDGITFFYRLKSWVIQRPWPGAIPTRKFVADSFRSGMRYYLRHN